MSPSVRWSFLALASFLVLFPLALGKPGLPMTLKSDEPAYYLMALSLAHDHDLVFDEGDVARLGVEFPYLTTKNLILATDDQWRTALYGKPYLVSLVAAPLTARFGADGFVATNMALMLLSVWLGALYLRQFNSDATALLFSAGYFLLSNAFAYVFWLHTETLCIASVTACLYLAFTPGDGAPRSSRLGRLWASVWNPATRPAFSGAALVAAAYNKPYLALLGLPAFWLAWRGRGVRGAATWLAGVAAVGVVVCGISMALIGHPSAYLGVERQGIEVDSFDRMPQLPEPRPVDPDIGPASSFGWIFSSFKWDPNTVANLGYFLVGRHTGLFLYAPFTLISLLLFLAFSRRSSARWILLGSLAGVALYTLTFIWFNWHGGGGFVGNRYYVNAMPGFLFLVTRIAPAWLPAVGYALAGLFVGGIVFTPFGAPVPNPTLQSHVRGPVFQLFPFERTMSQQIPGYRGVVGGAGSFLYGRDDQFRPAGDSLWVVGGQPAEFEFRAVTTLRRAVFEVGTKIVPNRVRLRIGADETTVEFPAGTPPGATKRVTLVAGRGQAARLPDGTPYRYYPMVVEAERQVWHHETILFRESKKGSGGGRPPAEGSMTPDWEENDFTALVGAIVTYLGEEADLEADTYGIDWLDVPMPSAAPAHRILSFRGRVRNTSPSTWLSRGATSVQLGYRWLSEDGSTLPGEGLRSLLPRDVEPGQAVPVVFEVETPAAPGRYRIRFDAVRQRIAWFADVRPGAALELPVEVTAPGGSGPPR